MVCLTAFLLPFAWLIEFAQQFSLFVFELLQAIGGILNVKWVHNGIVTTGHYCTAQGLVAQIGELGVSLIILVCSPLLMCLRLGLADIRLISFSPSTHS